MDIYCHYNNSPSRIISHENLTINTYQNHPSLGFFHHQNWGFYMGVSENDVHPQTAICDDDDDDDGDGDA
jgi:hypothetical protein